MKKESPLMPFFTKRSELSLFDGCILWGTRASVCRETILVELHELHEGHPGIVRFVKVVCMVARNHERHRDGSPPMY